MQKKHVFVDWMETDPGYGTEVPGYDPNDATPYGIILRQHTPKIDPNPILQPETPWENGSIGAYASFIYHNGIYQCWYQPTGTSEDWHTSLAYAESKDGIHWERPDLGLVEYKGSTHNNLLYYGDRDHGWAVLLDEDAPAEERYKMICTSRREAGGMGHFTIGSTSADGIHWNNIEEPFFRGGDTQGSLIKIGDTYYLYTKTKTASKYIHRRTVCVSTSKDFRTWTPPQMILSNDPMDAPDTDYYTSCVTPWPECEDAYLMLCAEYHRTSDKLDIRMRTSRDGLYFYPISREPFLPLSEYPPFDKCFYMDSGVLNLSEGEWTMYFFSGKYHHNDPYPEREYPNSALYRATLREDGFVSVYAESKGRLVTMPLERTGDTLQVNAKCLPRGYVKAEIVDVEKDEPVEGFTLAECDGISGDKIWQTMTWKEHADLSALDPNKEYRIRFELYKTDLYAYKF